jgi:phenylalanyl-tRNA synthetase beta chain
LTLHQRRRRSARQLLIGAGLSEAQTLSLLPPWFADRAGVPQGHELRAHVGLSNPLSEDESVLRPSLIPGLLLAAQRNVARRALPVRLFELGIVFAPGTDQNVVETERLGFVMTGPTTATWHAPPRDLDFFDGKGSLEALAAGLGVSSLGFEASDGGSLGHPGRSASVVIDGVSVGSLMELHPAMAEALELPRRVVVGELDVVSLFAAASESRAETPGRFPALARDVALVIPADTAASTVEQHLRTAAGPLLAALELFDVYRGDQIPPGTVSLAYALTLRDPERTLTDADADAVMEAIARAAADAGWTIRD